MCDIPRASEVTLKAMGKLSWYLTTTKHNKVWTICIFLGMYCTITLMSHEHHDVTNYWQIDCLFNSLFSLTLKKNIKALHYWPFVSGIHRSWVASSHKGSVMGKVFNHNLESHKHHGVSNHQQLDCLFNRLSSKKNTKALHYWHFVRGIYWLQVESPHNG